MKETEKGMTSCFRQNLQSLLEIVKEVERKDELLSMDSSQDGWILQVGR